jgi:hypothetical protein
VPERARLDEQLGTPPGDQLEERRALGLDGRRVPDGVGGEERAERREVVVVAEQLRQRLGLGGLA